MGKESRQSNPCDIIITGASGDLCRRKLMPALFALYALDMLPDDFRIFGYARSPMTDEAFRNMASERLICRYKCSDCTDCKGHLTKFLQHCFYYQGQYSELSDFQRLNQHLTSLDPRPANRLFYMSIPPSVFMDTATGLGTSGLMDVPEGYWSRIVLEKPFGKDTQSSNELSRHLASLFREDQIFRIDHYLGKEVIQNLMVMRFANLIFEPLWHRNFIKSVEISFSEKLGLEGRAGYFDEFGIIRDVMQNHLMQILALVAMEQPVSFKSEHIAEEKVKVLRAIAPLTLDNLILGQYTEGGVDGKMKVGYLDEPGVPKDSITETFARATFRINNPRWYGVPFYLTAGKALDSQKTDIHIQFRSVPYSIFPAAKDILCANDIHIRVQPNESMEVHFAHKLPGLGMNISTVKLDMLYDETFKTVLPEAYERLLLDVIRGDHSLFIQEEELNASWELITPVLAERDRLRVRPLPYPFGSKGPANT